MRYYRTRKPAWELRAGDLLESTVNGVELYEAVLGVRRLILNGQFAGVEHKDSRLVLLSVDGMKKPLQMEADAPVNLMRPKGGTECDA